MNYLNLTTRLPIKEWWVICVSLNPFLRTYYTIFHVKYLFCTSCRKDLCLNFFRFDFYFYLHSLKLYEDVMYLLHFGLNTYFVHPLLEYVASEMYLIFNFSSSLHAMMLWKKGDFVVLIRSDFWILFVSLIQGDFSLVGRVYPLYSFIPRLCYILYTQPLYPLFTLSIILIVTLESNIWMRFRYF